MYFDKYHLLFIPLGAATVIFILNILMTKALLKGVKDLQKSIDAGPVGFSRFAVTTVMDLRKLTSSIHFDFPIVFKPTKFFRYIERIQKLGRRLDDALVAFSFREQPRSLELMDALISEQNAALVEEFIKNTIGANQRLVIEANYSLGKGFKSFSPSCEVAHLTKYNNQILTSGVLHLMSNTVSLMLDLKGLSTVEVVDGDEIKITITNEGGVSQGLVMRSRS